MTPHPPQIDSDRFEFDTQIGTGGFGTVWRATDTTTGLPAAIKLPRQDDDTAHSRTEIRRRFQREYDILSRFRGSVLPTSVVRYIDADLYEPAYLALEYVGDLELDAYLSESNIEPCIASLERFGLPIVRGLEFLHHNGVCYLDLKPENVIVRPQDATPTIIDFNTSEELGTVRTLFEPGDFKAPEQLAATDIEYETGARADVYAAGKLLYFLLTGETIPPTETAPGGAHVDGDHEYDGLDRLIRRATTRDPTERHSSAVTLVDDLYKCLGHPSAVARVQDNRADVECLLRGNDTLGRISPDPPVPDVALADPQQHVSPLHMRFEYDDGWLMHDESLNGTYVHTGSEWVYILSSEGCDKLSEQAPERVPSETPYTSVRLRSGVTLAPVDTEYGIGLSFTE